MRTIATILVLTGITVPAAQAQIADGVPTGPQVVDGAPVAPKHDMLVVPADSIRMVRMAKPLLKCPMPVSRGIIRDSNAIVRPGARDSLPQKPAAMPIQRPNCTNPLFAQR
jgi:hypothetical protein